MPGAVKSSGCYLDNWNSDPIESHYYFLLLLLLVVTCQKNAGKYYCYSNYFLQFDQSIHIRIIIVNTVTYTHVQLYVNTYTHLFIFALGLNLHAQDITFLIYTRQLFCQLIQLLLSLPGRFENYSCIQ